MSERTKPLRDVNTEQPSGQARRSELDQIIDSFGDSVDFDGMTRKLEDFAKQKPIVLALTALGVGIAAGLLMRSKRE